jgi:Ner family transcriptional regulator
MASSRITHMRIKGALALQGLSFSHVARELGVAPSTVVIVSQGGRRSRRIEAAIAQAIHSKPETLWPDRYRAETEQAGR